MEGTCRLDEAVRTECRQTEQGPKLAEPRRYPPSGSFESVDERKGSTMALQTTMLDLVKAVSENAETDTEVVATVVHLVNSGLVRLCGSFRGARFDLETFGMSAAA